MTIEAVLKALHPIVTAPGGCFGHDEPNPGGHRSASASRQALAGLALLLVLQWAWPAKALPAELKLVGLRGAITSSTNSREAISAAVSALMHELIERNQLQPERVVSILFSATADLDALFPASAARRLPGWEGVALLDTQQLKVHGDLPRCIRVLVTAWVPAPRPPQHVYLGEAARLRPDRAVRPEGGPRP